MGSQITVSIISHRQNELTNKLLRDLSPITGLRVIVTENVPDQSPIESENVFRNRRPMGFGANHNAAFRLCSTPYFCVVNPDVRLFVDPFPALLETARTGVSGPLVQDSEGVVQDSARRYPTLSILKKKLMRGINGPDYPTTRGPITVDWIAGMFMLFASEAFQAVGGFDTSYFLYYEDVDICQRLKFSGFSVTYDPRVSVVHDARRASRTNPKLGIHHLTSMARYLYRNRFIEHQ